MEIPDDATPAPQGGPLRARGISTTTFRTGAPPTTIGFARSLAASKDGEGAITALAAAAIVSMAALQPGEASMTAATRCAIDATAVLGSGGWSEQAARKELLSCCWP